jgi:riboflavin synthase
MFTGLIEAVGEIVGVETHAAGQRLGLRAALARELTAGESLSVNGVCLTMTVGGDGVAYADIGPETARVTTLGSLRAGQRVNLERPLRADGRFGGHFVQGHVDGMGTVRAVRAEGDAHWLSIGFERALAPYLITKGAVAVDGVSLTVAALAESHFDVMIIPFTWTHTTLSTLTPGARVNIECDMIGKYVVAQLKNGVGGHL